MKRETPKLPAPPRGLLERPSGDTIRITAYLPVHVARAAKMLAAKRGRTVSEVVAEALEAHAQAAARIEPEPKRAGRRAAVARPDHWK